MDEEAIIIIACSIAGFFLLAGLAYCVWRRKKTQIDIQKEKEESRKKFKDTHTNCLRGNFVQTIRTPIELDYHIDVDDELGKGGCGVVVVGESIATAEPYAIKMVNKTSFERGRLERELKLLKDVDHPNIVRLFRVYDDPINVYFVMELCTGGHLGQMLARQLPFKNISEDWAKRLTQQLLSAVAHLHDRGICHRDIKLQNILLDTPDDATAQVKIIDFGYSARFAGALPMRTKCGTPYTTAPEVFREYYDERCDLWSVGVLVYIMLSGRRPFEILDIPGALKSAGKAVMITNILACRYHMDHDTFKSVSPLGIQFVKTLLNPDYKTRIRAQEALECEWITSINITNVSMSHAILKSAKSFKAVQTMVDVAAASELRRTGNIALAFGLQPAMAMEMRAIFQSFDSDASGSLSLEEFKRAVHMIMPSLTDSDIENIFRTIDVNGDNDITYTEFVAATIDPRQLDPGELSNAFQLMDVDRDGFITADELRKVGDSDKVYY